LLGYGEDLKLSSVVARIRGKPKLSSAVARIPKSTNYLLLSLEKRDKTHKLKRQERNMKKGYERDNGRKERVVDEDRMEMIFPVILMGSNNTLHLEVRGTRGPSVRVVRYLTFSV
jgi:hypothetical protein